VRHIILQWRVLWPARRNPERYTKPALPEAGRHGRRRDAADAVEPLIDFPDGTVHGNRWIQWLVPWLMSCFELAPRRLAKLVGRRRVPPRRRLVGLVGLVGLIARQLCYGMCGTCLDQLYDNNRPPSLRSCSQQQTCREHKPWDRPGIAIAITLALAIALRIAEDVHLSPRYRPSAMSHAPRGRRAGPES
jgi:hypothetical protein